MGRAMMSDNWLGLIKFPVREIVPDRVTANRTEHPRQLFFVSAKN